jgi:hypothetical protein
MQTRQAAGNRRGLGAGWPQLGQLLPLGAGQAAVCAGTTVPFHLLDRSRTAVSVRSESFATWPMDRDHE